MFKNFRDKIALSGVTVLAIGIILLIFTFLSAYGFLTQSLNIIASEDLVRTFGEALAPLIATCIRVMYLGIMGWISSLITIRGVTLIANAPKLEAVPTVTAIPQKPVVAAQPKPVPQKTKTEPQKEPKPPETKPPEAKPPEPEIIVIPPEEVSQPQPQPEQPQNGNSKPQSSDS
jgi:hypothetical protein